MSKNKKKPVKIDFSLNYVNEVNIDNGNIENGLVINDYTHVSEDDYPKEIINDLYIFDIQNAKIHLIRDVMTYGSPEYSNEENKWLTQYGLKSLRDMQKSGKSINEIQSFLVNGTLSNKENPQKLYTIVSYVANELLTLYDMDKKCKNIGNNLEDMLDNILSVKEGEQLRGFVCMNIHEVMMRMLQKCGYNAAVISGKSTNSEGHACLLYQIEKGKYAFTNYGKSIIINAKSIKVIIIAISSRRSYIPLVRSRVVLSLYFYFFSCHPYSRGTISFLDDNGSYQEFALKDETVWGDEIDKRNHNFEAPCNFSISDNSSINGNINISNLGNMSGTIQGVFAYDNDNVKRETLLGLSMQKMGESSFFDNSKSAGLKIGYKALNTKNGNFFSMQTIVAQTSGNVNSVNNDLSTIELDATLNMTSKETTKNEIQYFNCCAEWWSISKCFIASIDDGKINNSRI